MPSRCWSHVRQLADLCRPRDFLPRLWVWIAPEHELLGADLLLEVQEVPERQASQPAGSELSRELLAALPESRNRPKLQRVLLVIRPASAPWAGEPPGAVAAAGHVAFG